MNHTEKRWEELALTLKTLGEALQPFAIIAGIAVGLLTYYHSVDADRAARIQASDARERDLNRTYYEKQLDLYLESARVAAHLAAVPPTTDPDHAKNVARFWELYWGELAFVESRAQPGQQMGTSVESLMVEVCRTYVSTRKDHSDCAVSKETNPRLFDAIQLAHTESDEIRTRWTSAASSSP